MLKFKVTPQLNKFKFCLKPLSAGHLLKFGNFKPLKKTLKTFLFLGMRCKHCSKRFISSDAYKKHRNDNHKVKSITINGPNNNACQFKQQKAKGKIFHYYCFECFETSFKVQFKKNIVSCTVDTNGPVSKKKNFQTGSFSFSTTIETSARKNFNKFDLTTQKLNQNVSKT